MNGGDASVERGLGSVHLRLRIDKDGTGRQLPRRHRENTLMKPPPGGFGVDSGLPGPGR